jgi:hypothetical protein
VLKTSTVGNTFSNLGRQLLDGHWVLSFIDADRCAAARDLVDAGQVLQCPRRPLVVAASVCHALYVTAPIMRRHSSCRPPLLLSPAANLRS